MPLDRKATIQWSESAPSLGGGSSGSDDRQVRTPYREYPTPHPKKLAAMACYFKDSDSKHMYEVDDGGGPPPPPPPPPTTPALNQQELAQASSNSRQARYASISAASRPRRATLPHRSSTMDSEFFRDRDSSAPKPLQRTISSAEEGGKGKERPAPGDRSGGGIVSEILQFGMRHGMGGLSRKVNVAGAQRGGMYRVTSTTSLYEQHDNDKRVDRSLGTSSTLGSGLSYVERSRMARERKRTQIVLHVEDYVMRQKFLLRLAKALLSFGAPSHRIESQLESANEILDVNAAFVHLPNLIVVTFMDSDTRTSETHFVRAGGRVALTKLHKVHDVYRDVLHDKIGATDGCDRLKKILQEPPLYSIWTRCLLAFICASIICVLSFGGSIVDMFVSGASASLLQYLGLNAASKSTIYANVYEISVSIVVSFIARLLGTLPGNYFCYSAISSAGVVLILPGFTILIAALELTSRNILCGSVRMVYAIIYTLFLGFGLTIGSDFYLLVNPTARHNLVAESLIDSEKFHGFVLNSNVSQSLASLGATFTFVQTAASGESNIIKGCYRNPSWPWYRQPFPWWTMLFLVPIYSTCSSIGNLQSIRSIQLPIMVTFSCLAYAANRVANQFITDRGDIVSAFGAFVIGFCGNVYSRVIGGTAFTSMVTGVLFLVPSAIGNGGGLIQSYNSSTERYSSSFELGIRMIQVAIGVTIGLFISQIVVYSLGRRKNVAHFAF